MQYTNSVQKMRSVVLFLLWGAAAASLLFPARGDASVNTEPSPVPYQPSVDDEAKVNAPLDVIIDTMPAPSGGDVILEDGVQLDMDEDLELDDKRLHGKGRTRRSQGRRVRDDSKNSKTSRNRKRIKIKSKKQKRQRRKLNVNRDGSRNKAKGQKSKHRERKKVIRKRKYTKRGIVESESSGKSKTRTLRKKESVATPEDKGGRKRCRPKSSCSSKRGRCRNRKCKRKETQVRGGKCRGNRCVCCARSRKPAVCRQSGECVGKGTCRKKCKRGETISNSIISCYSSSCYCCVRSPPVTQVCRQVGPCMGKGTCRKGCQRYETIAQHIPCYSPTCHCCVSSTPVAPPAPRVCRQEGVCVGQGTCRKDCLKDETPAVYLPCYSPTCTCCLPSSQGLCTTHDLCTRIKGTCKAKCDGERVVAGLCPGPHCSCCIPAFPCSNSNTCRSSGGTCKSVCLETEVRLPGQCGEKGCFCCGSPPTQCTQTPICPGQCSKMCVGVVSLEAHCTGDACVCCLACSPKSACTHGMGVCKSMCGCGEKELPNGCEGRGCKCCVADILDCKENNPTCTNCVYAPLCTGPPSGKSCGHQNGCSCCAEKWDAASRPTTG